MFSLLLYAYDKVSVFLLWTSEAWWRILLLSIALITVFRLIYRSTEIQKLLTEIPNTMRFQRRKWYTAREIAIKIGENRAFHRDKVLRSTPPHALKYVSLGYVAYALTILVKRKKFDEMTSGFKGRQKPLYQFRDP